MMTQTPIASVPDMRARLSYLPRDIQREVCRLWNQGHMSAAIELVEKEAARTTDTSGISVKALIYASEDHAADCSSDAETHADLGNPAHAQAFTEMAAHHQRTAATLHALLARAEKAEAKRDEARAYLSRLLQIRHPTVEPLPDLHGVCTQIDNSLAGLLARAEKAEAERDRLEERFWTVVDRDGLTGVPSDMWAALSVLVTRAAERDRLLKALGDIERITMSQCFDATSMAERMREIAREAREEAKHD